MFGLSRNKTLDKDLCIEKVTDAVIDVWIDESKIDISKFYKVSQFGIKFDEDSAVADRLLLRKLEIICSVAYRSLQTEDAIDLIKPIIDQVLLMIKDVLKYESDMDTNEIFKSAKRLAEMRSELSSKDAGHMIENDFSEFVFQFKPGKNEIDPRYLLYQQLSGLERSAITKIGFALRQSKI